MVVVPEFLIRRVYKKGSIQKLINGVSIGLKNVLGPGFISGFNFVKINDILFEAKNVKFITNGEELDGEEISEANPVAFRLGQEGTLVMTGQDAIIEGTNKITIEVMNPEAGKVQFKVEDNFNQ